jgi:hypothetical protein
MEQFSIGSMIPSVNIMRMIEDTYTEDEAKMQQSLNFYDKCSTISKSIYIFTRLVVHCSLQWLNQDQVRGRSS